MQTHNNKWKIDVKHGRFFIFTYTILITNLIFFISLFSSANALTFSFDALFSLLADGVNFIKTIRISDLIALIIQILSFSILVLSYIFGIIYFIFRINYARRGLLPRLSGIEIFLLIDLYLMAYNLFFAFLSMTKIWGVE
jgi:hypothetical protein